MKKVPPLLVLIFNRPIITQRLFEAPRLITPPVIYIVADGPRNPAMYPEDEAKCTTTRDLLSSIDWHCRIHTRLHDQNQGCAEVAESISWFFEHESEGLILEDDCIPHPDFFRWGGGMLEKYRTDLEVFAVNGTNMCAPATYFRGADYAYTTYPLVWGWGTWARAWKHYQLRPAPFTPSVLRQPGISHLQALSHYNQIQEHISLMDTWDCQWTLSVFRNHGICVTPRFNLISNIGFGSEATHTQNQFSPFANQPWQALPEQLSPPKSRSPAALNYYIKKVNYGSMFKLWRRYWKGKFCQSTSSLTSRLRL